MSTGNPTYWPTDPNKIPELIEFFIVGNMPANFMEVKEGLDMNSDHSPIVLIMSKNIIKKESNPMLVNKHADWTSFKIYLENKINLSVRLISELQLDEEVELFVNNIQLAAWENTPKIKRKTAGNNYPREIRELIMEKRKLRRK